MADPVIQQWIAANPWFLQDQKLNNLMVDLYGVVIRLYPSEPTARKLDLAKQHLITAAVVSP